RTAIQLVPAIVGSSQEVRNKTGADSFQATGPPHGKRWEPSAGSHLWSRDSHSRPGRQEHDEAGQRTGMRGGNRGRTTKGRPPSLHSPIGGSALEGSMLQPLGAISYVRAMLELLEQVQNRGLKIDGIVFPTGSGSMHAGILVGAKLLCPTLRVVGVSVSESVAEMTHIVGEIAEQTLRELRMHSQFEAVIDKDDIRVFDYVRNGYGVLDSGIMSTIRRVAEAEGLLLDPVYTAKA